MSGIFNTFLTDPLFNALVFLFERVTFGDLGLAIILLTVFIRLVLYPVFYKGLKNQALMQKMQPELKEVQKKHKGNREEQATAMMALYKKYEVNPFSPFLYLLIQLPILFAVYRVFLQGFSEEAFTRLYSFMPQPEQLSTLFLGLIDVTKTSIIIVVLAVLAQYLQTRISLRPRLDKDGEKSGKPKDASARMSQSMMYIVPAITLIFLLNLPSAIGLYWLTTAVFSIFQQRAINKRLYGQETSPITNNH
ncbi:MAG: hypothetical protein COU11_03320 [Candidatus Harrisonbacteria bacterium CG10_big_fil_rev_8_21_14_0_10_49_15]|uniref:Membrane insertase YidC/Oxa/ALB C-terminal domain-containing protein n=1 Tax=Candidatus Harrisonbacteria bacterium CG10_big_fil_rev_8_21_14_0_10_49_15 TaxID=1974587 RepID=A0A2H0UKC2_9BACT|nr:MAG: hypothetical protein COU11_03320 [Candidatus Harrisonbacteria bacterium CG10_big_fil_rev_8_21_14_0_10_49_15]